MLLSSPSPAAMFVENTGAGDGALSKMKYGDSHDPTPL